MNYVGEITEYFNRLKNTLDKISKDNLNTLNSATL